MSVLYAAWTPANAVPRKNNDISSLLESIRNNRAPAEIDLKARALGDRGVETLAEALKQSYCVTSLNLTCKVISRFFSRNFTPHHRHVGESCFFRRTNKTLSLYFNLTIYRAFITDNEIGIRGIRALAELLKHNVTISSLSLGYNNFGNDGVRELCNGLHHNRSLRELVLSSK
jgi:Ran GTPase-activating protein (RanGAP) involved in mRNA processing and transport